jgi:hypothetical protein
VAGSGSGPAEVEKDVEERQYALVLQAQEVGLFAQRYRVDQPRTQTEGQGNSGDGLHRKQQAGPSRLRAVGGGQLGNSAAALPSAHGWLGSSQGWLGSSQDWVGNLRSSRSRIPTSRWNSDEWSCARVDAWRQLNGHQRANVPRYLPKAKFAHPIRGHEISSPFALATPLYSIVFD